MGPVQAITDVPGLRVGHAEDPKGLTGCTVILCEKGAIAGVDLRGSATGTRQMDALSPFHVAKHIHAVFFSGGSAFGLDAAAGVMQYLEARGVGFPTRDTAVPIVPAAILYDLSVGDPKSRPTPKMALQACERASSDPPVEGNHGAGMGATVGKLFGPSHAMKGGVGTWSLGGPEGSTVGALAIVNAFGDVLEHGSRRLLAGSRKGEKSLELADTWEMMRRGAGHPHFGAPATNLCCVATDARLTKGEAGKLARMASAGLVKTVRPASTQVDGDVILALSTGTLEEDLDLLGLLAEEALAIAINRAVIQAESVPGLPAYQDLAKA
jgi:L-aminopeptidase/D-esterase-like protein